MAHLKAGRPLALVSGFIPLLLLLAPGCATRGDIATTQTQLADVRGNIEGLESFLDRRQAGLSEELQELVRIVSVLKERDDELRQVFSQLQQRLNVNKIETDENFRHIAQLNKEYQRSLDGALAKINARIGQLETGLGDLRMRIDRVNAVDVEQDRRLGQAVNRLDIFLEEMNAETNRLGKGLGDLTRNYNGLVETVNQMVREQAQQRKQDYNALAARINELDQELASLRRSAAKAAEAGFHVVAPGDTLSGIAARYGVTVDHLVAVNQLTDPNNLQVGQKLRVTAP